MKLRRCYATPHPASSSIAVARCVRRRPQLSLISPFPRRQRPDEQGASVIFPDPGGTDDRGPAPRTKISERRPTLASEVPAGPDGAKGWLPYELLTRFNRTPGPDPRPQTDNGVSSCEEPNTTAKRMDRQEDLMPRANISRTKPAQDWAWRPPGCFPPRMFSTPMPRATRPRRVGSLSLGANNTLTKLCNEWGKRTKSR
jgi:hypothetical protein